MVTKHLHLFFAVVIVNFLGWTLLHSAAENNQLASAKWLLEHGSKVNAYMETTGWSPLHAACKQSNAAMVELLLKHGANRSAVATHREFGRKCLPGEVTSSQAVRDLLTAPREVE
jgi:ankyrin repeat protein